MAEGYKAATDIASYLSSGQIKTNSLTPGLKPLMINNAALANSSRAVTPRLPAEQRKLRREDSATLASETMELETMRCANCGCVAVNASDVATALIALDAQVKTTKRMMAAEELFAASINGTTCLANDELIQEIYVPTPEPGSRQVYLKFRTRNAIDFPIVSVAFRASIRNGRFHDARVVLGAVAPVPLRAHRVEELLEDKISSEQLASEAAILSVSSAQPLARNKAKVEIVKALVKKAILTG